jgi:L-amino acid N-acyltransferase YncA
MPSIRLFQPQDWNAVWAVLEPVFKAAETYAFAPDISQQEARREWIDKPSEVHVAEVNGDILGTYYVKANQSGQGSHVCNCGYVVDEKARGQGLASKMCEHSQQRAKALGFRAMQYNLVVSTNVQAITLWERHGFETVGRLPGAFRSPTQGYVDALVMYKTL